MVLLQETRGRSNKPFLTPPLKPDTAIRAHNATIQASDVIGKDVRQLVKNSRGSFYRVNEPSLAAYTILTPRIVTPVRLSPGFSGRRELSLLEHEERLAFD